MKYITLIYEYDGEWEKLSEKEHQAIVQQHNQLQQISQREKTFLAAVQLKPARLAVSVRKLKGEIAITDGPFIESKELFVGYYVFECADLDTALHLAKMIPAGLNGGVEVRPLEIDSCEAIQHDSSYTYTQNSDKRMFALLVFQPEIIVDAWSAQQRQELIDGNTAMVRNAMSATEYVSGGKLMSTITATAIRYTNNSKQNVTDGPFAEAKEVLVGQHIVACGTIGDAIAYAEQIPDANLGVIEVRPIHYLEQIGINSIQWTHST